MRMTISVPGRVGAAFLSSAITVLLFGVMVYCRDGVLRPLLGLLPMPEMGGIVCVSYLIWFLLWLVLDSVLGGHESVGTLPIWTAIVLGATLLSGIIAEMSFAWQSLVH
jgi:hypothetical protein